MEWHAFAVRSPDIVALVCMALHCVAMVMRHGCANALPLVSLQTICHGCVFLAISLLLAELRWPSL